MAARLKAHTLARLRQHLEVEEAMGDPEVARALEMLIEWHEAEGAAPATSLTFGLLRHANEARDEEWNTGAEKISLAFRGVELAGEAGEACSAVERVVALLLEANRMAGRAGQACNVIKKLERATLGIAGSRASLADLAAELADVVICADLIAMHAGIDLEAAVVGKFNATSEKYRLATLITLTEEA